MAELTKQTAKLRQELDKALKKLDFEKRSKRLDHLKQRAGQADFWQTAEAQSIMKEIANLEAFLDPWQQLDKDLIELEELTQEADPQLELEIEGHLDRISDRLSELVDSMSLSGPYDQYSAILSIYAGAGGTDAQDWTQMLFRMYQRYFEKQQWSSQVIEESPGDEAGLKSITLEVKGSNVYGLLKGEQGVHRLVRLSPFNADHLRQTSFAKVEVLPEIELPQDLAIESKDLRIDVYRSSGHGGQSVNTTDSAVRITHIPTGLNVSIQNERSQTKNREIAMTILRSKLAELMRQQNQSELDKLKGPNQSAEWGQQIRNYVLHPYKQVKDLRSGFISSDPDKILDGELADLIEAGLKS